MSTIKGGIVIPRDASGSHGLVAFAQAAEERGVPQLWSTVGGASPDPVTAFAAVAATTDHIRLGTAIVPAYPLHPITLASQVLALESLAPKRIRLGIGTSHRPSIEDRYGIPMTKPLTFLREYLTILRAILHDGGIEYSGEFLGAHIELPEGISAPGTPVPISALRQNAFSLAGELADGAVTWLAPMKHILEVGIPAMESGAARAGRTTRPPVIAHVPVAVSEDRETSRQAFRQQFPVYSKLPFYANMFADAGFPVNSNEEMTDDLVDELAVSGSPVEISQRLSDLHAKGIDEFIISQVVVHDAVSELKALSAIIAG